MHTIFTRSVLEDLFQVASLLFNTYQYGIELWFLEEQEGKKRPSSAGVTTDRLGRSMCFLLFTSSTYCSSLKKYKCAIRQSELQHRSPVFTKHFNLVSFKKQNPWLNLVMHYLPRDIINNHTEAWRTDFQSAQSTKRYSMQAWSLALTDVIPGGAGVSPSAECLRTLQKFWRIVTQGYFQFPSRRTIWWFISKSWTTCFLEQPSCSSSVHLCFKKKKIQRFSKSQTCQLELTITAVKI